MCCAARLDLNAGVSRRCTVFASSVVAWCCLRGEAARKCGDLMEGSSDAVPELCEETAHGITWALIRRTLGQ
jgi:hypothetical protein